MRRTPWKTSKNKNPTIYKESITSVNATYPLLHATHMKMIIGLGNYGKKYNLTRHNVGFFVVEKIGEVFRFPAFTLQKQFNADISTGKMDGSPVLLVKPHTYMNASGEAVKALCTFYKLSPSDLCVIHDDLDLPIGTYRRATDSRAAGHNGVQNIIDQLHTQAFCRMRIGIRPDDPATAADRDARAFVLEKCAPQEMEKIASLLENIRGEIESFLKKE